MDDPNSKLAEHIRFVHFTLVVVTVTLLIATIGRSIDGAQKELNSIINLIDTFKPEKENSKSDNKGILGMMVREILFSKQSLENPTALNLQITDKRLNLSIDINLDLHHLEATVFHVENTPQMFSLQGKTVGYSDFFSKGVPNRFLTILDAPIDKRELKNKLRGWPLRPTGPWKTFQALPSTINQFKEFWDVCSKMRHAYIPYSFGGIMAFLVTAKYEEADREEHEMIGIRNPQLPFVDMPNLNSESKFLMPLSTEETYVKDVSKIPQDNIVHFVPEFLTNQHNLNQFGRFSRRLLVFLRNENGIYSEVHMSNYHNEIKPGDVLVVASNNFIHKPLNLQDFLLARIKDEKRQRGSFESSFPEIQKFLADLNYKGQIEYELLNTLFLIESKRSGHPLEIAGLKIERVNLHLWGIAVVLAIQLYFYLHLKEFTTRSEIGDEALSVAWIGFYPGVSPLIGISISIVALPIAVSALILWKQFSLQNLVTVNNILCVLSISTALLTTRQVKGLRYLANNKNKTGS